MTEETEEDKSLEAAAAEADKASPPTVSKSWWLEFAKEVDRITPDREKIGNDLQYIRSHEGITQADVASEAGISRQWYNVIERGKTDAEYDALKKICKALKRITPDGVDTYKKEKSEQERSYWISFLINEVDPEKSIHRPPNILVSDEQKSTGRFRNNVVYPYLEEADKTIAETTGKEVNGRAKNLMNEPFNSPPEMVLFLCGYHPDGPTKELFFLYRKATEEAKEFTWEKFRWTDYDGDGFTYKTVEDEDRPDMEYYEFVEAIGYVYRRVLEYDGTPSVGDLWARGGSKVFSSQENLEQTLRILSKLGVVTVQERSHPNYTPIVEAV